MPFNSSIRPQAQAHLLMVDDNSMGLNARKAVLEELGYKVTTVDTPQEALERLSQKNFDLVITDYRLPKMNGSELIKNIRNLKIEVPTILLSGFTDALGLDEKNTGADVVLQKSAHEIAHLVRTVKNLLKRGQEPSRKQPSSDKGPGGGSQTRKKA